MLCASILFAATSARAQTPYPMLMSLKPTAATVGTTSEHVVSSRYSMYGAYKVQVSGRGVTGEIVPPKVKLKKGAKPPNLTKLTVRFQVAADALPGVREFRIATPQGVSTIGQLVIVRDPVVVEKGKNNTPAQAQPISLPATVCGAVERSEDVDCYKFKVSAGTALSFYVRGNRLENKIHDLQEHLDPIITIRTAAGATLAAADNYFAGDPFLNYRFKQAGDYVLEVRDVRYHGRAEWEYAVEINSRPFVTNVFPMGIARGKPAELRMIGFSLPAKPTLKFTPPKNLAPGVHSLPLPLAGGQTDPVPIVIAAGSVAVEAPADNDTPKTAQSVTLPALINGRIEKPADIDCFRFPAKRGEKFSFDVIARRQQSLLDSNLRILNAKGRQLTENDDSRHIGRQSADSWIENWTAPADGEYVLEIRDVNLDGGDPFVYAINVTRAKPYFELTLDTDKTELTPGTAGAIFVRTTRKNGFQGEIKLNIAGLPPKVTARCGRILAGSRSTDGCIILEAARDAKMTVANITVTGTATIKTAAGKTETLTTVAHPQQEIYMPGGGRSHWPVGTHTVSIGAPNEIRGMTLSTYDLTLKPGQSKRIDVTIERAPGFNKNVTLDLLYRHLSGIWGNSLPAGVTIDAAKSKTLLTKSNAKGYITLKAAANATPVKQQQVSVMANISINFVMKATYSSRPLLISVAK